MKNKSTEKKHTINGNLIVESVYYTGKNRKIIKTYKFSETLEPMSDGKISLEILFTDYYKKLLDQSAFNISCMASVEDTDFEYFAQDDFRVRKPDIKFVFNGKVTHKTAMDVSVKIMLIELN